LSNKPLYCPIYNPTFAMGYVISA